MEGFVSNDKDKELWKMLRQIHERIQRITDHQTNHASANVSGVDLWQQKEELIKKADRILDELEKLCAQRP